MKRRLFGAGELLVLTAISIFAAVLLSVFEKREDGMILIGFVLCVAAGLLGARRAGLLDR